MFMSNDLDTNAQYTPTGILVPVLADGTPIIWDGNDAHIEGTVHDVGNCWPVLTTCASAVGLFQGSSSSRFQPLSKHRAVALSNGKLAVDNPNAVYFLTGVLCLASTAFFDNP